MCGIADGVFRDGLPAAQNHAYLDDWIMELYQKSLGERIACMVVNLLRMLGWLINILASHNHFKSTDTSNSFPAGPVREASLLIMGGYSAEWANFLVAHFVVG